MRVTSDDNKIMTKNSEVTTLNEYSSGKHPGMRQRQRQLCLHIRLIDSAQFLYVSTLRHLLQYKRNDITNQAIQGNWAFT